jgi:hypothetical protein
VAKTVPPIVTDHELLYQIGRGSYGGVWLARSVIGTYRAVKIVFRDQFEDAGPYEREFRGIQKFEPVSRGPDAGNNPAHLPGIDRNSPLF